MPDSLYVIDSLKKVISYQSNVGNNTDIFKDYILPILTSFIAILGALWISKLETNKEKAKENKIKKEGEDSKLLYLATLVNNIIKITTYQIKLFKTYHEELLLKRADHPRLFTTNYGDLKRLTETNLEDFIIAYVNSGMVKKIKAIKDVSSIMSSVDNLFSNFEGMAKSHRDFNNNIETSSKLFMEHYNASKIPFANFRINIDQLKQAEVASFSLLFYNKIFPVLKNRDLQVDAIYENYIIPSRDWLIAMLNKYGSHELAQAALLPIGEADSVRHYLGATIEIHAINVKERISYIEQDFNTLLNSSQKLLERLKD